MFDIQEELKKLPEKPGVYIMKDKDNNVLYVGKASVLKNRVRQYFQKTNKSARIQKMVSLINHFEYIVVDSEIEALILECNLIKLHRPKYNVLLKDDKMYPYIKITLNEDFPIVRITRKVLNDGARYFGPYTNAYAVKETVEFINNVFNLKRCKKTFKKGVAERPCLNYHIKKCMGICQDNISKEEYNKIVNQVMLLLDGKTDEIIKMIDEEMKEASENLNFEKAAKLRDKKTSIENLTIKQKMDNFAENDMDIVGIVKKLDRASIQVFYIRNSKMIGGDNFIFRDVLDISEEDLFYEFIKQFYNSENVPSKLMFKYEIKDLDLIKEWLWNISGKKNIDIKIPKKGEKMRFIEMAEKNAEIALKNKTYVVENESILLSIMEILELNELPKRIESYDISNISGTDAVCGIVVFENAKSKKGEYRRLKIKTVEGQDDVSCMKEALLRRLKYCVEKIEKNPFGNIPNLILMDGGIHQVRAAKQVIESYNLEIPVYGMVKNDKHKTRALIDYEGTEIDISKNSEIFNFITLIQDEVHKTAIEYHRKLRDKKVKKSLLDDIPGIGEKRKKALINKFKSVERIKKASIDEIAKISGITPEMAKNILDFFNK